ncbi:hypothetical protein Tco_1234279 [Tanacetum coccineum]
MGPMSTYSSNTSYRPPTYSNNLDKMINDFDLHQEKRLSSLRTQFQQQQDDISNKLNALLKMCSKRFNNNPAHNTTHTNAITSSQLERAEPRNKEVIKSPSKLLSLKFQEQSSLKMFNERTSSPKRVHFVNTITLVKKESKDVAPIEQENLTKSKKLESSKVSGEINNDDFEEEEDEEDGYLESFNTSPSIEALEYHEWLSKNPRPHWVRAKIRTGSLHNI